MELPSAYTWPTRHFERPHASNSPQSILSQVSPFTRYLFNVRPSQGKVWYVHNLLKYEFDLEFDLPVSYPDVAPELALPEIDGKTEKMYRGGKICLDSHFRPLWARNVPQFGIAHAMALGMAPWLAVEIPALVAAGRISHKESSSKAS